MLSHLEVRVPKMFPKEAEAPSPPSAFQPFVWPTPASKGSRASGA